MPGCLAYSAGARSGIGSDELDRISSASQLITHLPILVLSSQMDF